MWATKQEALAEWRSRTLSPSEYDMKLEEEYWYQEQKSEAEAEYAWLRHAESGSHYMGEPDWAM